MDALVFEFMGLAMLALTSIEEVRAIKREFRRLIEQNPEGPVKRA